MIIASLLLVNCDYIVFLFQYMQSSRQTIAKWHCIFQILLDSICIWFGWERVLQWILCVMVLDLWERWSSIRKSTTKLGGSRKFVLLSQLLSTSFTFRVKKKTLSCWRLFVHPKHFTPWMITVKTGYTTRLPGGNSNSSSCLGCRSIIVERAMLLQH